MYSAPSILRQKRFLVEVGALVEWVTLQLPGNTSSERIRRDECRQNAQHGFSVNHHDLSLLFYIKYRLRCYNA